MRYLPAKPQFDVRDAVAEALQLYTEWRAKDEEMRAGKGKSKHDWRELGSGELGVERFSEELRVKS